MLDRIRSYDPGAPACVLVADRCAGEQFPAIQCASDLRRRREGIQRIGRLACPMAGSTQLEQGTGALGLALDPDLDCGPQSRRGIVEGERGARRPRRAQVVVDRALGPAEWGGCAEVVGEVREDAVGASTGALEGFADAEMQFGSPQPREAVIQRPPDDLVGEAAGQSLGVELLDHAAAHRLLQRGEKLGLGDAGGAADRLQLELRPGSCRKLEQLDGARRQARQPLADHLAHAVGRSELGEWPGHPHPPTSYLNYSRLHRLAPQLADEEGVAGGEIVDRTRELVQLGVVGVGVTSNGTADQVRDLRPREPLQAHAHNIIGAAQVGKRLRELRGYVCLAVAEGREDQQAGAPGGARQVSHERQRRRVRPMPVLEHEQYRPCAADVRKQLGNRRVQTMALGIGVRPHRLFEPADPGGQVGQQPGQLAAAGAERGTQLRLAGYPHQAFERLDKRPVRRAHHRVTGAVENEHPFDRDLGGELARQTTLPGTRLAREQRDAAPLPFRPRHQGSQLLELCRAADERGDRGRAQRVRKVHALCLHEKTIVSLDHDPLGPIDIRALELGQLRS